MYILKSDMPLPVVRRVVRIILRVSLYLAVATAAVAAMLAQVHDFPQTRMSLSSYQNGGLPFWPVAFYFFNEASSGMKYALSGDSSHLVHFPRGNPGDLVNRTFFRRVRQAAIWGGWRNQVHLALYYALGWGTEENRGAATQWYLRSKRSSVAAHQFDKWIANSHRISLSNLLAKELENS